jgi:hypothetical protein
MVTNKLSTVANLKVKLSQSQESIVSLKSRKVRPLTYSKDNFNTQKLTKEKSIVSYAPKYRQSFSKNRNVNVPLQDINKICQKENMSRNQQFSPILSMDETDGSYENNSHQKSKQKFKPVLATRKLKDKKKDNGKINNTNKFRRF